MAFVTLTLEVPEETLGAFIDSVRMFRGIEIKQAVNKNKSTDKTVQTAINNLAASVNEVVEARASKKPLPDAEEMLARLERELHG